MTDLIKDTHPCSGDHCLHQTGETMSDTYWGCCLGECDYTERRKK